MKFAIALALLATACFVAFVVTLMWPFVVLQGCACIAYAARIGAVA